MLHLTNRIVTTESVWGAKGRRAVHHTLLSILIPFRATTGWVEFNSLISLQQPTKCDADLINMGATRQRKGHPPTFNFNVHPWTCLTVRPAFQSRSHRYRRISLMMVVSQLGWLEIAAYSRQYVDPCPGSSQLKRLNLFVCRCQRSEWSRKTGRQWCLVFVLWDYYVSWIKIWNGCSGESVQWRLTLICLDTSLSGSQMWSLTSHLSTAEVGVTMRYSFLAKQSGHVMFKYHPCFISSPNVLTANTKYSCHFLESACLYYLLTSSSEVIWGGRVHPNLA